MAQSNQPTAAQQTRLTLASQKTEAQQALQVQRSAAAASRAQAAQQAQQQKLAGQLQIQQAKTATKAQPTRVIHVGKNVTMAGNIRRPRKPTP